MNATSAPLPTPIPVGGNRIRPHGVWIIAGGLAVAGLALAGVVTWNAATGADAPAAATPPPPVLKTVRPAKPVAAAPLKVSLPATCATCGVIESVQAIKRKGEATGLGAVAGGVAGAVLGNQVGKGHGREAMTVIGAVGGGVAGHEIEKQARAVTVYEVRVRMEDGSLRTLERATPPAVGQRVRMEGKAMNIVGAHD